MTEPLLSGALRVLLPSPTETLLLRACLCRDLSAWRRWSVRAGDPKRVLGGDKKGIKRLVPLLYVSLRDAGADLDAEFLSYLRAAYVREEWRARVFRRVGGAALETLTQAGVPFLVLKGVSLVESVYPAWALRHCHDVDVLIHENDLSRALAALREYSLWERSRHTTTLIHATHLPISLHTRLFEHYATPDGLWENSIGARAMNADVRVPAPHHALVHICVHAASSHSRRSLVWTADAMHLLSSRATADQDDEIDWQQVIAASNQTALPLFVMLRYLREELEAPVPAAVLESLASKAHRHRVAALRSAICGSATGGSATGGARHRDLLRQARGWKERFFVGAWIAGRTPRRAIHAIARKIGASAKIESGETSEAGDIVTIVP